VSWSNYPLGNADCLLKNTSTKQSKYVVNQKLEHVEDIELEIKDATDTDRSASYLDLHLEIDSEGRLKTKLYGKKDDFNFHSGQPSHGGDRKTFEVMTST
jgi:hypothetical protein